MEIKIFKLVGNQVCFEVIENRWSFAGAIDRPQTMVPKEKLIEIIKANIDAASIEITEVEIPEQIRPKSYTDFKVKFEFIGYNINGFCGEGEGDLGGIHFTDSALSKKIVDAARNYCGNLLPMV